MKAIAERFINADVTGAVITVPAHFDHRQRQETMNAAKLAGLKVLRLINEPTAAAIAYRQKDDLEKKTILIFDLGGGTFDVSIVKVNTALKVIAVSGHNHLGGQDFDQLIMQFVKEEYRKQNNKEFPTHSTKLLNRLRKNCQEAKHLLSFREQPVTINIDFNGEEGFNCVLTREKLNEMIEPMLKGSLDVVDQALQQANLKEKSIDLVLLIGGSTRIPLMQALLGKKFGKTKLRNRINPDEAVALGASILAHDLKIYPDNIGENLTLRNGKNPSNNDDLSEITPLSIGLQLRGQRFLKIIEKGTKYPCRATKSLATAYDNQIGSFSGIYEGERANVDNNKKFGEIKLELENKKAKRGYQLEVLFEIDINGILHVTKTEVEAGKTAEIEIKYDGKSYKDADIKRIVEEAGSHKREDEEFENMVRKRDDFEDDIYVKKRSIENSSNDQTALEIVNRYLAWSDKLPQNIADYDRQLNEFKKEIAPYLP
ncbi:hypothetical protein WR25_00888 [Diploscapter pachys]|uniref:Uncharacterized protein n=1 Tax=Diploscapter pachys TaxID=2018661 RepID=A0A2A2KW23_9BILA|nr:hypothetical protein WR25_00888 [Diploscapter pachys]